MFPALSRDSKSLLVGRSMSFLTFIHPNDPCTVYSEEAERKALLACVTQSLAPPGQLPSLRGAIRGVASLGGFLGRKSDGDPGAQTLWLGLQRLDDITAQGRILALSAHPPSASCRRYE